MTRPSIYEFAGGEQAFLALAALPDDPELRGAMRDYIHWATREVNSYAPAGTHVEPGRAMPHWSWDGLQEA